MGSSDSGTDRDRVNKIALECYQSGWYTSDEDAELDFACPTCDTLFPYISALLQHVESDVCEEDLEGSLGKFIRYLRKQIT